MNASEFDKWLARAKRGQSVVYHEGYLYNDRGGGNPPQTADQRLADTVGKAAMRASGHGLVALVQRRLGDLKYQYIAQRTRMRLAPAADLIG